MFTLTGSNFAHRRETVHILGRLVLNGMLALHVELLGHLVTVIAFEIVVQWLIVPGNAPAYAGGMGRKDRGNLGDILMDIEQAQACHPFVAMIDDLLIRRDIIVIKALYDARRGIREHRGLVVIAIGMKAVDLEVFPQLAVDRVLLLIEPVEVDKYGYGVSRDGPAAYPD